MDKTTITRRKLLRATGSYLAVVPFSVPFLGLASCGGSSDSSTSSDPASGSTTIGTSNSWASGGTELITVDYPADSLFDGSSTCSVSLTESTTEGPCYFGVGELEDISTARTGLPMMLCFQLIDEDCNPLEGYLIEVWHCDNVGLYSGDTSDSDDDSTFAGSFCTDDDTDAEASQWFRGEQTTDSSGRVNFKSCFPGWYAGRTIHIHFRVRSSGGDYVISQVCFSDSFAQEICTTHDLYSSHGEQDTTLASGSDTVFPASGYDEYLLNIEQNSDNTLLAYKRIIIDV